MQGTTTQPAQTPAMQLKTNRGLLKFILLSIVTFGIYGIVVMSTISTDINYIASKYDGKKTMHYCLLVFLVGPITLGIADLVWYHRISNRIGLVNTKDPKKVEFELKKILPPEESNDFCHRVVLHGREVCTARRAMCDKCCLSEFCKKKI